MTGRRQHLSGIHPSICLPLNLLYQNHQNLCHILLHPKLHTPMNSNPWMSSSFSSSLYFYIQQLPVMQCLNSEYIFCLQLDLVVIIYDCWYLPARDIMMSYSSKWINTCIFLPEEFTLCVIPVNVLEVLLVYHNLGIIFKWWLFR